MWKWITVAACSLETLTLKTSQLALTQRRQGCQILQQTRIAHNSNNRKPWFVDGQNRPKRRGKEKMTSGFISLFCCCTLLRLSQLWDMMTEIQTQTMSCKNWSGRRQEDETERSNKRKREWNVFLLSPTAETLCPVISVSRGGLCYGAMALWRAVDVINIALCETAVSDAASRRV